MKKKFILKGFISLTFLLLFAFGSSLTFAENPSEIKITSFVNDYAQIFSNDQELTLSNSLQSIQYSQVAEVSIVTIKSLEGYDAQHYAQLISEGNLGESKKNNGLLLLIAVDDRSYWFNVGRGLEPIFNDAKIGRIGRENIVPYFKESQYYEGTLSAIQAISKELGITSPYDVKPPMDMSRVNAYTNLIFIGLFLMMILFRYMASSQQTGPGKRKRNNHDYFIDALILSSLLRGGKGGGGGFGGGGFGGGSFGGGGAGGKW